MILIPEPRPARDDYPRDRYGRVTLNGTALYGPSALPNYLGAGFSAPAWAARHQAKGAGLAPWLGTKAAPLDPTADRAELDAIVSEMEIAGGRQAAADRGTATHSAVRRLWHGFDPDVPEAMAADIDAIRDTFATWGLRCVDGWDERFVICHDLPTGGTADAYITCDRIPGVIVADVKTGSVKPLDCAIQLAAYAHSTHTWNGVGDPEPIPFDIRTDIGLIIHAPWGRGQCSIIAVDLTEGYRLAQLAVAAHRETLNSGRVVIKDLAPYEAEPVATQAHHVQVIDVIDAYQTVEAFGNINPEPRLTQRIGTLRRRAKHLTEQHIITVDDARTYMAEHHVPALSDHTAHTADTVDQWETWIATHELALDAGQRIPRILERLKALPADLYTHAETAAKNLTPPVPHLIDGNPTGPDLDRLEHVLAHVEQLHSERVEQITQALSVHDMPEAIIGWATETREDICIDPAQLTQLEADRVLALCETYRHDDLAAALKPIGAREAVAIARPLAELHKIPVPTKGADIAADRLLAGLVLNQHKGTNTNAN